MWRYAPILRSDDRKNMTPINHPLEAMAFLLEPWNCRFRTKLFTYDHETWEIDKTHFTGPYDSSSGTDYFPVTDECARYLINYRLVSGIPQWGYTSDREFRITEYGITWFLSALEPHQARPDPVPSSRD